MSTPPAAATEETGRTRQRNSQQRSGNRGRFNRDHGRDRPGQQRPQPKKFTGKEEALGDEYVYQHTDGRDATDQYARTTEEIIRYTSTKYKNGGDVERSLADGTLFTFVMPAVPTAVPPLVIAEGEMAVWKMRAQIVLQRTVLLEANMESAYSLIKGQCSKLSLEKVEAQQGYATVHAARDPIGLLELIKGVMFNYNSRRYRAMSLIDIIKPDLISQTRYMTDSEYLEKFRTQLDVLHSVGGEVCTHEGMVTDELARAGVTGAGTPAQIASATLCGRHRFEAALFLAKSNQSKYGRLLQELANDFNKGRDSYPESLTAAYELMLHDVREQDSRPQAHGNDGLAFNTVTRAPGGDSHGTTGVAASNSQPNPRPDITCHRCGKVGHFAGKCREPMHANGTVLVNAAAETAGDESAEAVTRPGAAVADDVALTLIGADLDDAEYGFQFFNKGIVDQSSTAQLLSQHKQMTGHAVPASWILLDNQSTVDVFSNKSLLRNVRKGTTTCRISCNAGVVGTNMIGDLPGYPTPVWYHPQGIANILSLSRVSQHCRVQYDSEESVASFHVTKPDGTVLDFKPSVSGLHYCDSCDYGTMLINTVAEKRSKYTRRAFEQAALARRIQNVVGRPSTRDFLKIVEGGMLRNCPVSRNDIMTAEDIFGPNLGSLKGKTVRSKNAHVPSLVADVPYHIIKLHKDVTVCFDIMFVNKIAFLITVSRNIRFGTTERLLSRKADTVGKALINVLAFYRQRGFRVKECHGDGEFESLRAALADAHASLNITAEDEHVPEIERYIRTVKERTRCVYNVVPFQKMPGVMIVELVHSSNYWLNMFPANDGVSTVQSPRRILTGQH
jgi:hypothetical protein